jgi:hypothetical protein
MITKAVTGGIPCLQDYYTPSTGNFLKCGYSEEELENNKDFTSLYQTEAVKMNPLVEDLTQKSLDDLLKVTEWYYIRR